MINYQDTRARLFPEEVIRGAQYAQRVTGCPASVTLAQWAQESGFGKYLSGKNNFFGIKWHAGSKRAYSSRSTKECIDGKWITVTAKFVDFPTMQDAFVFHGELIMSTHGPYAHCVEKKNDWAEFVACVAPIYATDPHYRIALQLLIAQYHLSEFDTQV